MAQEEEDVLIREHTKWLKTEQADGLKEWVLSNMEELVGNMEADWVEIHFLRKWLTGETPYFSGWKSHKGNDNFSLVVSFHENQSLSKCSGNNDYILKYFGHSHL